LINKTLLKLYNIPQSFGSIGWEDVIISAARRKDLRAKFALTPQAGLLVVQGTAAPVIKMLHEQDRSIRGIDFMGRVEKAFESHSNPIADVVLIYNVGKEISINSPLPKKVLKSLVTYYQERAILLVIQTDFTKADLLRQYDVHATNFVKLMQKEGEAWI